MATAQILTLPRQSDLIDVLSLPQQRLSVLYGGAMGGGKSHGIAIAGLLLSHWWPNNRGFIGRLDFKDLRETTYKTCIEVWGDTGLLAQHNKNEHWVRFTNGSEVLFGELKDEESRKSLNLGWYAIDEATEVPEASRLMLLSRLRWNLPGIKYREVLATNPGPGWVKRDFYEEPRKANHYFVPSLPTDNSELPEDYVPSLEAIYPDIWIKRFLKGSWDAFEGQVFDEFDKAIHVAPAVEPSEWWRPKIRSIDHGLRNPTCCLWMGVDNDDVIHVYDEHYQKGQPVSHHAKVINAKTGAPLPTVIDPSTQNLTDFKNGSPWSVKQEYLLHGVKTVVANNARMAGILRVKELLKTRRLVIHANCVNLLRELPEYGWKDADNDLNLPEDAAKKNDHAVDAFRYGIVALRPVKAGKTTLRDFEVRDD